MAQTTPRSGGLVKRNLALDVASFETIIKTRQFIGTLLALLRSVMVKMMEQPRTVNPGGEMARNGNALVFVVDDQQVVAELTAAILELEGFETQIFHDPESAFDALDSGHTTPDILLTDYQMPTQSGLDLIERSKDRHPELRTILFSGSAKPSVYADRRVKPDEFLEKSFAPQHLLNLVKSVLDAPVSR